MKPPSRTRTCSRGPGRSACRCTGMSKRTLRSSNPSAWSLAKSFCTERFVNSQVSSFGEARKWGNMYTRRFITMIGAQALAGALFLTPSPILGQARPPAAPAKGVKMAWTMPRLADGHPDLQGVWTTSTLTPLERPAEFGDKAFLTAAEAAEYEKRMAEYEKHELGSKGRDGDLVPYNDFWTERNNKVVGSRRTSLIVDPPDGKIP